MDAFQGGLSMNWFETSSVFGRPISDAGNSPSNASSENLRATSPSGPPTTDANLLDAYSQAVIHVVETVSPAVISVTGQNGDGRGGSGSGFLLTPDGYAITNSHVVNDRPRLSAETAEGDRLR